MILESGNHTVHQLETGVPIGVPIVLPVSALLRSMWLSLSQYRIPFKFGAK